MNNVIRGLFFLILLLPVSNAMSDQDQKYLENAYKKLLVDYRSIYDKLNKAHEECDPGDFPKIDYSILLGKLPKNLDRQQINSALFLHHRNYQKKCISESVSDYFEISVDVIIVLDQQKTEKLSFIPEKEEAKLRMEIEYTFYLLKSRVRSYLHILASYESIKESDKEIFRNIVELKGNFNYVELAEKYNSFYKNNEVKSDDSI